MLREGVYADVSVADYVKGCPLFSAEKDTLQIQLFYYYFETTNLMGSKKGLYRLGAIYFTLWNLPQSLIPFWLILICVVFSMHRIPSLMALINT